MDYNEFYRLIGQITYSFARIDFVISNIAVDLGIVKTYQEFYANRRFEWKIKTIKKYLSKAAIDMDLQTEFEAQLAQLEILRIRRNNLTHAIILSNKDDLLLHNFSMIKDKIQRQTISLSMADLTQINQEFIDLHNAVYTLWQRLKT